MATQYTPTLKLALPVQGELSGSWGDVVNDNITSMVEQAVTGLATIDSWTANSHTLTTANGTTSEARCAILELTDTGTALTGAGTVICPDASKLYTVRNSTGQIITLKTASGSGIAIPDGHTAFLYCDATNVVESITSFAGALSSGDITIAVDDTPTINFKKASTADVLSNINVTTDAGTGGKLEIQTKRNGDTALTALTLDDGQNATFAGDVTLDATSLGSTVRFIPAVNTSLSTIRFDEAAGTQRASLDFLSNTGDMFIKSGTSGWGGTIDLWTNGVTALTLDSSQNATFAGTITGSGSGLTALNGSNISSGTVAAARVATLNQNTTGSAGSVATADESSDTTCFMAFTTAASGNLPIKTNTNATFNSSTGLLTTVDMAATSDERLKFDITPIDNPLEDILKLQAITHGWNDRPEDGSDFDGFIAQEVYKINPTWVNYNEATDEWSVNYAKIIVRAVGSIQKIHARLEALEGKV
jgi:hypothetical protein